MKNLSIIIFLFLAITAKAQENRYEFKSIRVEYKSSTTSQLFTMSGTKLVVIDNYGQLEWNEVKETEFDPKTKSATQSAHTAKLIKGDKYFDINMAEKTGYGITVNTANLEQLGIGISYKPSIQKYAGKEGLKLFVTENGGTWLGEEMVAGKNCQVFTLMEVKMWMYKGLVLRTESNLLGTTHTEIATKVEENIKIDASIFEVPGDVKMEELEIQSMFDADIEMDEPIISSEPNSAISGISFQQFKEKVLAIKPDGYQHDDEGSIEDEGSYLMLFTKGNADEMGIAYAMSPLVNLTDLKNSVDVQAKILEYKIDGREAVFYNTESPVEENVFAVIILYPEYNAFIMVMSDSISDKAELEKLILKLKF